MAGRYWRRSISLLAFGIFCLLSSTTTAHQNGKCSSNGGKCVPRDELETGCKRSLFRCPPGSVCCLTTRPQSRQVSPPKQVGPKRKCVKRKPCTLQMGICVPVKKNTCTTGTDDTLCKGASCTCCLDVLDCKQVKKCTKKGGHCMKVTEASSTCAGNTDARLCKGSKCTCCLSGSCQCGRANEPRIVGGQVVTPKHKYPWLASIYSRNGDTFFCGASVIDDRHILTAAHCMFRKFVYPLSRDEVRVGLADHNLISTADDIPGVTKKVEIEDYVVHEQYNSTTSENDIAVIRLKEPLSLTADGPIRPICLPADDSMTYEGDNGIVAGWGKLQSTDSAGTNVSYEVSVPILSPDCPGEFPSDYVITQNNICAGLVEGGKDSCQGDSGGPLVVLEGQTYTHVGVVSFGDGCAKPNSPGIYTRTSKYLDWIKSKTQGGKVCPPAV
ncbi:trypsin-like [Macrobrachium nipponense]|uniref:trypsin-like n=1 Tax=Macrobrachium nipponense TaxID=159736 RepID=UPI0030C81657